METAAEIQVLLDGVTTGISRVVSGGQEYTFDTGQTKHTVKRGNLKEMQAWRNQLKSELSLAVKREAGSGRGRGTFNC